MTIDDMPKPTDLMEYPQLASLIVLEMALAGALRLLLAQHTNLLDNEYPKTMTEADTWADRIILAGHSLAEALWEYRDSIRNEAGPLDDVAF
jgi:hypothetical protein